MNKPNRLFQQPLWMLVAAFGTYFCMYGFRRPYTAATYNNSSFWGIEYKFLLVIAQTIGYVAAKWLGIKVVAEVRPANRIKLLLALIGVAELMLLLFAIIPRPWNIPCLLLNGLCLGVVFGLVLGFLEGRRNSEALIAGLCASFIVSDGVSKSIGKFLLDQQVSENWMPFFAGLLFLLPTLLFSFMLQRVQSPTSADVAARSVRTPMSASQRWAFFLKYGPGISAIILIYLLVTLLRSVRADFAPELWRGLGYKQTPALFTQSELIVSLGVVIVNGLVIFIGNHHKAFRVSLLTSLGGFTLLVLSVWLLQQGLGKFPFMVLVGLGVYIPYVAVHTTLFERLIAATKEKANIGFLMYMADSVGYTGYVILIALKYFVPPGDSILFLFLRICVWLGIAGGVIILFGNWYFRRLSSRNVVSLAN
jgi:hypothetical protein